MLTKQFTWFKFEIFKRKLSGKSLSFPLFSYQPVSPPQQKWMLGRVTVIVHIKKGSHIINLNTSLKQRNTKVSLWCLHGSSAVSSGLKNFFSFLFVICCKILFDNQWLVLIHVIDFSRWWQVNTKPTYRACLVNLPPHCLFWTNHTWTEVRAFLFLWPRKLCWAWCRCAHLKSSSPSQPVSKLSECQGACLRMSMMCSPAITSLTLQHPLPSFSVGAILSGPG